MGARRGTDKTFTRITSAIFPVGTPIDLAGIDMTKAHVFVGTQFFADALGAASAVPLAGTVTVTIQTINTEPRFEDPPANVINAATPTTITWAANTLRVLATPAGIDVATHYRITVTCNET